MPAATDQPTSAAADLLVVADERDGESHRQADERDVGADPDAVGRP